MILNYSMVFLYPQSEAILNLFEAPFQSKLKVKKILPTNEEVDLVLRQLGLGLGETIEKLHVAPLGDPLTIRIGGHRFSLRKELCRHIEVEVEGA